MKVRFYGFSVKEGPILLSSFFDEVLKNREGREFKFRGCDRLLYVSKTVGFYVGLILTPRDQRRFCELHATEDKFKIKVRELEGDNRLVEFNFFVLHKKSGNGLFQHYRGSFGLNPFCFFLRRLYADECESRRDKEIKAVGDRKGKTRLIRDIRSKYKTGLDVVPLFKAEDFEKLVQAMTSIHSISFACDHFVASNPIFTPSRKAVTKERHTITYSKSGGILKKLKTSVLLASKSVDFEGIAVSGTDVDGTDSTYHLESNLECFGTHDFDEMADELALDLGNIANSKIAEAMFETVAANAMYF